MRSRRCRRTSVSTDARRHGATRSRQGWARARSRLGTPGRWQRSGALEGSAGDEREDQLHQGDRCDALAAWGDQLGRSPVPREPRPVSSGSGTRHLGASLAGGALVVAGVTALARGRGIGDGSCSRRPLATAASATRTNTANQLPNVLFEVAAGGLRWRASSYRCSRALARGDSHAAAAHLLGAAVLVRPWCSSRSSWSQPSSPRVHTG